MCGNVFIDWVNVKKHEDGKHGMVRVFCVIIVEKFGAAECG